MNNGLRERFGKNCKRLRKSKQLTQEMVAERSGLPVPSISALESGKANPTLITVERLALGLGVEIFELFSSPHAGTTPAEIRKRLKLLVDATNDQDLEAIQRAVLLLFKQ